MLGIRVCCIFLFAASLATAEIKNKGWWKKSVFYQIYPRSFMDSDGDGVGDLKGITQKMEYFVETGINVIWLSPIFTSPMVDFGYDISDFIGIHPEFGTMADFEEMMAKAKKLGLRVVLDLVPNHTSDKHEWFQKSLAGDEKYKNYYMWSKGRNNNKDPPSNWISVFSGSSWKYVPSLDSWYLHQFEYRQPDLNFTNPEVRAEMEEVIRFWLRKGVHGFRIDSAPYFYENDQLLDEPRSYAPGVPPDQDAYLIHTYTKDDPRTYELIQSWRKVVDDYADQNNEEEKVLLTEAYTSLENTTRFYKYGSDIAFNFQCITKLNKNSKPSDFKREIDGWISHSPPGATPNWVMGNHDNNRTASRYPGRGDQMTMLGMILPGVAVTYNGEEIGMVDDRSITWEETQDPQACIAGRENFQRVTRDPCRTPFQWDSSKNAGFSNASRTWLPVNQNYKTLNLANEKKEDESHYKIYQLLIALRKLSPAVREGSLKTVVIQENVLAVIRSVPTQTVVLLINFSDDLPQTINLRKEAALPGKTIVEIATLNSPVKAGTVVNPARLTIPAKASLILSSTKK